MNYVWAFVVGGFICVVGQLLIDYTKLTPARILVCFVSLGAILTLFGIYEPLIRFAGAGASVPLTGFGYTLATGVMDEIDKSGFIGIFTGGFSKAAGGITAAILFGYIFSVIFKPKAKK